jgi:hypothetical protein
MTDGIHNHQHLNKHITIQTHPMFVVSAKNMLCSTCMICFALDHSSLHYRNTTQSANIEHIRLQSC